MRTVHFRSLALAAVAALTFVASGAAQDRAPGLLNNLEVRQLVHKPPLHTQLNTHFTTLPSVHRRGEATYLDISEFHRQSEPQSLHRYERALQATCESQHAVGNERT